jgi:hypothetical protein
MHSAKRVALGNDAVSGSELVCVTMTVRREVRWVEFRLQALFSLRIFLKAPIHPLSGRLSGPSIR